MSRAEIEKRIRALLPPGNEGSKGEIIGVRVSRHACSYRVGPNASLAFCVEDAAELVELIAETA